MFLLSKLLFFIALTLTLQAAPHWYENYAFKSNNQTYYAYGEGVSKDEAYQNAVSEIAKQLKVEVSSKFHTEERLRNDNYSNYSSNTVSTFSNATLKNVKIKESSQEGHRFYVLLAYNYTTPFWYESRSVETPLFSRLGFGQALTQNEAIASAKKDLTSQGVKVIGRLNPIKSEIIAETYFIAVSYPVIPELRCSEPQNSYLAQTALVKSANKLTTCDYNYELIHQNGMWYVQYENILEKLTPYAFSTLLLTLKNPHLSLTARKHDFLEGDGFHLHLGSTNDGYVSVLNVYEDGRVGVVLSNQVIKKNVNFTYPDYKSGQEFVAHLIKPSVPTKDMYVALFSLTKLDLTLFEEQASQQVTDKEYRFNDLLTLFPHYNYVTLVLRTRPTPKR